MQDDLALRTLLPNTKDAAIALGVEGTPPRQTAAQLGVPLNKIYGWFRQAREQGHAIPHFKSEPGPRKPVIRLDDMLQVQLQIAARRRGTTVTALGTDLLTAICTDNLVDAVLGDVQREGLAVG